MRDLFEHWQQLLQVTQLLLAQENVGVVQDGFHALGIGDEVRRDIATIELHPSTTLKVVSAVWPSSTVMTPSFPTRSMASAMRSPISGS